MALSGNIKKTFNSTDVHIYNGYRTERSPIRSAILRVIKKKKSDDCWGGDRFVNHERDYRQNWTKRSSVTNSSTLCQNLRKKLDIGHTFSQKNSNSELGEMCDKNARTWRTLLKSGLWRPITFENFVIVLVNNSTAGSSSRSDRQIWYTSSDHRQNQQHSSVLLTLSP